MPVGASGRIVIEVEPEFKHALYEELKQNGLNLKEWFVQQAEGYLRTDQAQLELAFSDQEVSDEETLADRQDNDANDQPEIGNDHETE